MKNHNLFRISAFFTVLALAIPAFAKPVSKTITLAQTARIGKATLEAGNYRLLIDGNKATVEKSGQKIAESEGRWEDRGAKSQYNSVLIGTDGNVREVRFAGQKTVFVFGE